jgi:hypothetical protein
MSADTQSRAQEQPRPEEQTSAGGEEERESQDDVNEIIEWNLRNNSVFIFSDASQSYVSGLQTSHLCIGDSQPPCFSESQKLKEFLQTRGVSYDSLELEHFCALFSS